MAGPERQPITFKELSASDAEPKKKRLMYTFGQNLQEFIKENLDEKHLILLKFIENRDLVSFMDEEHEFGFKYGDLREKFMSIFDAVKSPDFSPVKYSELVKVQKSAHLPTGLEALVGETVLLVTTTYPFAQRNSSEGISIIQEEYRNSDPVLTLLKRREVWTAKRIHFSNSPSGADNTDRRLTVRGGLTPSKTATHVL